MEKLGLAEWPPIRLSWSQKLAAFWSISWPAWFGALLIVFLWGAFLPVGDLQSQLPVLSFVATGGSILAQILLVDRLFQKEYQSFRIAVVRPDGSITSKLSGNELARVALRIVLPQMLFFVAVVGLLIFTNDRLDTEQIKAVDGLMRFGRLFVVGPYTLSFVVGESYRGFRVQAYGRRLV